MSVILLALLLAFGVVAFVLYPLLTGKEATIVRSEEELTDAQHRTKVSLLALRDIEYDFHAGKLDETDYLQLKQEVSLEALSAIDAEEAERRGDPGFASDGIEAEIAALRATIREGIVCPECGWPNPKGSRFCGDCGAALPRGVGSA